MAGPDLWPPAGLRVSGAFGGRGRPPGRVAVTLRTPTDPDLAALAGIFPTDAGWDPGLPAVGEEGLRGPRSVLRHAWRARAELGPERWRLVLAVEVDGTLVGQQDLKATHFGVRRIVETSSWLAREHRGRGIATGMRALALHLAFTGLHARAAESESSEGNVAALAVTRSLGYEPSGDVYLAHAGGVDHRLWSRLTRDRWASVSQRYDIAEVTLVGVEACLPLLDPAPETEL